MKICIAGWYFTKDFIVTPVYYSGRQSVFIVKHREGQTWDIPAKLYPNVGLEFGAYDQYLQNHWDGESDVLFIHDDATATSNAFHDVADLAKRGIHQAFIFNNEWEEIGNKGKHGRAIWCSASFLSRLKADGGFPYDASNTGTLTGPHVNDGIEAFTRYVNLQEGAGYIAIVPGIQHGRRGELPNGPYVYHRKTREGAVLMPGAPNHCLVINAGNVE